MTNIKHDANAFGELGDHLVEMSRALTLNRDLLELGELLRRFSSGEIRELRQPLDAIRVIADWLRELEASLRAVLDNLTPIVGVDN